MVSTADFCTPPGDLLPVSRDSVVIEEVADVSSLPFARASDNEKTEAARQIFRKAVAGGLNDEADTFLRANNIPTTK